MMLKRTFTRNAAVSLGAIAILYFAVVAAIGDTVPHFAIVPDQTASPGAGDDTVAHPGIDGVKNADAVIAVLFPAMEETWTAPARIEQTPQNALLDELTSFATSSAELPLLGPDTQGIAAALNIKAGNAPGARASSGFGASSRGESAKGIPSAGFGGFAGRPAAQADSSRPLTDDSSIPETGKSLNKPAAQESNNDEGYTPVQIAAIELPPALNEYSPTLNQSTDSSVNDDDDIPRNLESSAVAVPEPASLLLLLLGFGALYPRKFRHTVAVSSH